jgi:hypothetical protein
LVPKVCQAQLVQQGMMEQLVHREPLALQACQVRLVRLVQPVLLDLKACQAQLG